MNLNYPTKIMPNVWGPCVEEGEVIIRLVNPHFNLDRAIRGYKRNPMIHLSKHYVFFHIVYTFPF